MASDAPVNQNPVATEESKKDEKVEETVAAVDASKTEEAKPEDAAKTEDAAAKAKPEPPVKYNVHKLNFEKDVIYLYQFSRTPLLPSLSPYCLKVETWLRLAGLKYEVRAAITIL